MAQVSQQANPLHDEGKSKKKSEKLEKYEKNWKEINGTKVYYDKVYFQVMADADKEDDGSIDHFMDEVENFINNTNLISNLVIFFTCLVICWYK